MRKIRFDSTLPQHLFYLAVLPLAVLFLCILPAGASTIPAGAIAAYDMESTVGGNLVDITGHGHNSSNGLGSGVLVPELYGNALYMNGVTPVSIPHHSDLNLAAPFSMIASFKMDTVVAELMPVVGKGHMSARNYGLWASNSPTPYWEGTLAQVMQSIPEQDNALWTTDLDLNRWYHLAATHDGSTLTLYVDGIERASDPVTYTPPFVSDPLTLGGGIYHSNFRGYLDNIAIYNRVLTLPEIQQATLIELISFNAVPHYSESEIDVVWETASEVDCEGFHLWRAVEDGEYVQITEDIISAEGGPIWGASYTYEDLDVEMGKTYWYKLEDVDIYGHSTFHGPVEAAIQTSCGVVYGPTDRFGALWLLVLMVPVSLVVAGGMKLAKKRKATGEKKERPKTYEPPKILTYSGEELLHELGPAQACRGFTCPVSPTP